MSKLIASYKNTYRYVKSGKLLKNNKNKYILIIISFLVIMALFAILIHLGYSFNGTGFNTQTEIVKPGEQIQPAKTLWDWMQLLIVPIVLVIGGFIFNWTITRNEQKIAQKRFEMEHENAVSARQESLLQNYLDKMTSLLINDNALDNIKVRNAASALTIAVISRLDEELQANLIQFLYNAGLIKNEISTIISLKGVNIEKSDFFTLNLSKSNLEGIRMDKCVLYDHPNFDGANLNNSEIFECSFSDATLRDASIVDAYLTDSVFNNADFSRANLYKTRLARTRLKKANLTMCNLSEAIMEGAYVYQANLFKANLSNANLNGADMREANLQDAILHKADLSRYKVFNTRTNLSNANLNGADMREANLQDAILCKANLTRVNFSGANLTGADLTGANLENAILDEKTIITPEQLSKAEKSPVKET